MDDIEDGGVESRGGDGVVWVVPLWTFGTWGKRLCGNIGAYAKLTQG